MIEINNIRKKFNDNYVLKNINLAFPNKGMIIIEGESGSGKSTLLNIIGGLILPSDGYIKIDGVDLLKLSERELDTFRIRNLGYIYQSFNLLELESVLANVRMPLESISNTNPLVLNKRVEDILNELGILHLKRKVINRLSGGEKQRVAIAKALVNNPKVLLCDEPTGALDSNNTKNICEILKQVSLTSLVLVVTHDVATFKEYADRIISIKDGHIYQDEILEHEEFKKRPLLVISNSKHQRKPHLPLSFKFTHAFHKISSKKWRFMISNFMLSLSITGIGLSMIISTSMGDKIQSAFSSLLNGNQILVTPRNTSLNDFGAVYSASESDVQDIAERYEPYLNGAGVTYIVNFEDFFKDGNRVYISDDKYSYEIPSLSARSFNDYRWVEDSFRQNISPSLVGDLDKDEVVVALSYVDMINIAYNFKIKRTFDSLANFIYHNQITLSLNVINDDWQYSDEQIFKIKGIFEAETSYLCHTRKLWNKEIFEDDMRFPSSDGTERYFPWEMYKLHYLNTKGDPKALLDAFQYDDGLYDFVFERTTYDIHPLLCPVNEPCKANRLLVYNVDKNTLRTGTLLELINRYDDFKDYFFMSSGGYVSYGSMILDGFANTTFFSISLEKNETAIDADTKNEDETLKINLPKGVLKGSFMDAMNDGVKFSTRMDKLISGRTPDSNKEIVISSRMAKALDNGHDVLNSYLFVSSLIPSINGDTTKNYRTTRVKIVGIVDSDKNMVYHNSDWTISFFRDELGMSSFLLCPNSLVIELDENVDPTLLIERLNKTYYDFRFSSPLDEVSKSINSTLEFIKLIVVLFSILSGAISLLLLVTLLLLNILENEHEVKIFKYSGISYNDINSQFVVDSLLQTLIAFMVSMIELIVIDVVSGKAIDEILGVSTKLSINFVPILITFIISIGSSYLLSRTIITIKTLIEKRKRTKLS